MTIAIISLIIIALGLGAIFASRTWAPVIALLGLTLLYCYGPDGAITTAQWIFWGVACVIAFAICRMLPRPVSASRAGVPYIAGGATAGALVGMLMGSAGLIVGSALGAFLGALAYSRTPSGAIMDFPSKKFVNYLCAKGLPAVVVSCVFAMALIIIFYQ